MGYIAHHPLRFHFLVAALLAVVAIATSGYLRAKDLGRVERNRVLSEQAVARVESLNIEHRYMFARTFARVDSSLAYGIMALDRKVDSLEYRNQRLRKEISQINAALEAQSRLLRR